MRMHTLQVGTNGKGRESRDGNRAREWLGVKLLQGDRGKRQGRDVRTRNCSKVTTV